MTDSRTIFTNTSNDFCEWFSHCAEQYKLMCEKICNLITQPIGHVTTSKDNELCSINNDNSIFHSQQTIKIQTHTLTHIQFAYTCCIEFISTYHFFFDHSALQSPFLCLPPSSYSTGFPVIIITHRKFFKLLMLASSACTFLEIFSGLSHPLDGSPYCAYDNANSRQTQSIFSQKNLSKIRRSETTAV